MAPAPSPTDTDTDTADATHFTAPPLPAAYSLTAAYYGGLWTYPFWGAALATTALTRP